MHVEAFVKRGLFAATMLRSIYGLVMFAAVALCAFDIANLAGLDPAMAALVSSLPVSFYLAWGVFVSFYFAAAWLIPVRPGWALGLYSTGFILDFGLTTQWYAVTRIDEVYAGQGDLVDTLLNGFDLCVIALLALFIALRKPV